MKHDRTVRELTFRASDTAPPCTLLIDPDPLAAKRYAHAARWTWTEEEGIFFATVVLETLYRDLEVRKTTRQTEDAMAGMANTLRYLASIVDPEHTRTQQELRKKRLTPKRKGA